VVLDVRIPRGHQREQPCRQATAQEHDRPSQRSTIWLTLKVLAAILNHMVDESSLDAVFHALSDPTRRAMLRSLSRQHSSVGELAAPFHMSLAAASKHIKVLERAGLVQRQVHGRIHTCRLQAAPLHAGLEWMRHYERFWNERLDALDALLKAEDRAAKVAPATVKPVNKSSRSKR
jgi:DNA-binding transcriptional ArsR family regulator